MLTSADVEQVVATYAADRPRYDQFVGTLVALLRNLLSAEGLDVVNVNGRAKDVESFRDKITREGKSYGDPLTEVTDLCGARVVCYDVATVQKIGDVIAKNFAVDAENSVDKAQKLDPDRFGYLSVHFIVQLNEQRQTLPEYQKFAKMKAEIQIRTALQHAWAALDHGLRYKSKQDVPRDLRRRLYRISALLELADDEFLRLKEEADKMGSGYATGVKAGNLESIEVNADSVDAFVRKNPKVIQNLSHFAEQAGFALAPRPPNQKTPWTNLVGTLEASELHTLGAFDEALNRFMSTAPNVLKALASRWSTETDSPRLVLDPPTLLRMAVVFSLPRDKALAVMKAVRFGPSLQSVMEHELNEAKGEAAPAKIAKQIVSSS